MAWRLAAAMSVRRRILARMEVHPATTDRVGDVADLFGSNTTTRGCWCMCFRVPLREFHGGWRTGANRVRFEERARTDDPPPGLLAYRDGTPVGWCALGPRSRYPRAIGPRAVVFRHRDPGEDDTVWLVPCFFVRVGARKGGTTQHLLTAAVALAETYGASAIEGWPLAGPGPHKSDRYYGTEPLFAACGFAAVDRPTPGRVVMRRDLAR
jgi:hypothetical protein